MSYLDSGSVKLIQSDEEFEALRTAWNRLYERSGIGNPFLSYAWARAWRSGLCPASKPFILAHWVADTLTGILPLRLETRLGIRVLRFLVDGRADYMHALHDPADAETPRRLYRALEDRAAAWDIAILRNWNDAILALEEELVPEHLVRKSSMTTPAPYLALRENWNDMIRAGPKMLRQAKRKASRFAREGGTVELIGSDGLQDIDSIVSSISSIESQSWKFGTRAARFQSDADKAMLKDLLASETLQNQLEIWLARLNEKPVAFLINFSMPTRTSYYQGAFDNGTARLSPGAVLHYHAIKRAWETGRREYDFMMGDDSWKRDWTSNVRMLTQHVFYRSSPKSKMTGVAFVLGKTWGRRLKQSAIVSRTRKLMFP